MTPRYTTLAIALHWLIALMIVVSFTVGLSIQVMPLSPQKVRIINYHKWAGITIWLLVCVRLAWRLSHRPPAYPASMPQPLQLAAHLMHASLYVLMFVIPISGWMMSSAKGFPVVWLGLIPLPDLLAADEMLGDQLKAVHGALNFTLAGLVLLHAAAALKHHFVDKDDIMRRMLFRFRQP